VFSFISLPDFLLLLTKVLYMCVRFWLLDHLTRDLSPHRKKMNFVTSWTNVQNDNYFTLNYQNCHLVVRTFIFYSAWDNSSFKWTNSQKPTYKNSSNNAKIYENNKICLKNLLSFFHKLHQSNNFEIFVVSFISIKNVWVCINYSTNWIGTVYKE
jgi:hypothetical protein